MRILRIISQSAFGQQFRGLGTRERTDLRGEFRIHNRRNDVVADDQTVIPGTERSVVFKIHLHQTAFNDIRGHGLNQAANRIHRHNPASGRHTHRLRQVDARDIIGIGPRRQQQEIKRRGFLDHIGNGQRHRGRLIAADQLGLELFLSAVVAVVTCGKSGCHRNNCQQHRCTRKNLFHNQ